MGKRVVTPKVVVKEPVAEVTKIADVKQVSFEKFTITMNKALESDDPLAFGMVRDNDNQVIPIKSKTLDATDKTKVTLITHLPLRDGKTYTVTYTATDAEKTQSPYKVIVSDGTVKDVTLTPTLIPVNQETVIKYQTLDANSIVVDEGLASKGSSNVKVSWDAQLGTMNEKNSGYILYNDGDTATFTVDYHTWNYDPVTNEEKDTVHKEIQIKASKDATVIDGFAYTVATSKPYSWSTVEGKEKHQVALEDTDRYAYFRIMSANGTNVTGTCGYTVESTDNSVIVADGDVTETKLSPVAKGSAYLMIKNQDGDVVKSLPITVGDKRVISTVKLSKTNVSVVTDAAFDPNDASAVASKAALNAFVDVTAKDQYGDAIAITDIDIENTSVSKDISNVKVSSDKKYLVVNGQDKARTDRYTVTAYDAAGKTKTAGLTVTTVEPKATPTYSVVFVQGDGQKAKVVTDINTTGLETKGADAPDSQAVKPYIVKVQNGVVSDVLQDGKIKSMTLTKSGSSTPLVKVVSETTITKTAVSCPAVVSQSVIDVATKASLYNANPLVVSGSVVSGTTLTKTLDKGTYTIVFNLVETDGKTDSVRTDRASASFTVTDTQTPVTAKVNETNYGSAGGGSILEKLGATDSEYIEYYFGDQKTSVTEATDVTATRSNGNKNIFVTDVTVTVQVAETNYKMNVKVPVRKTFITTGNPWDAK